MLAMFKLSGVFGVSLPIIAGQLPRLTENEVILYPVVADFVAFNPSVIKQVIWNEGVFLHPDKDGVAC